METNCDRVLIKSIQDFLASSENHYGLTSKLKDILKANHVTDPVAEILIKESGMKAEGNGSQTYGVTVKFESPTLEPLHWFIKQELEDPVRQEINRECKMFEKESVFFMEYLPLARQLCIKKGHECLMDIYPKCYFGDKQLIVLEDLAVNQNYFILNKEEMQDFEAATLALTTLAKHHAISYALINDIGGYKKFLEQFPSFSCEMYRTKIAEKMLPSMFEDAVTININILENSSLEENEKSEAIATLKSVQGQVFAKMVESFNAYMADEFRVLNHGDYWNNNMMFLQDKSSGNLTGHIALDFQVLRYCTPAVDLGYYLFTSVKPGIRQSRLQELFTVYLDVLSKTTNNLGFPLKVGYERIYNDFCKTFQYGYFWGLTVATGAGFVVLKDMHRNEADGENSSNNFTRLVSKWIEKYPEKSEETAKLLVGVINEYRRLTL